MTFLPDVSLLRPLCTPGQRPASAASGGSTKRSWADEFYDDAPPLPPPPAADDFPSLGGGGGGGSIAGAWGNSSHLKTSCANRSLTLFGNLKRFAVLMAAALLAAPGMTPPASC